MVRLSRAAIIIFIFALSVAFAQSDHPRALTIQAAGIPPSGFGGCSPRSTHPCDVFSVGSDVHIVVVVTNVSDHSVTYRNLRWGPATAFEVRDASGNLAPETEELQRLKREFYKDGQWRGHFLGSEGAGTAKPTGDVMWLGPFRDNETVLQPGKLVSFGATPNRYYDMNRPGIYSIVAKRQNEGPPHEWVYSNEIKVTITAKESN